MGHQPVRAVVGCGLEEGGGGEFSDVGKREREVADEVDTAFRDAFEKSLLGGPSKGGAPDRRSREAQFLWREEFLPDTHDALVWLLDVDAGLTGRYGYDGIAVAVGDADAFVGAAAVDFHIGSARCLVAKHGLRTENVLDEQIGHDDFRAAAFRAYVLGRLMIAGAVGGSHQVECDGNLTLVDGDVVFEKVFFYFHNI